MDHEWQSINSSSFTGDPLRELHFMLDHCISAMTPLMSEGAVYTLEAPDLIDDIRHNTEVHVKRTIVVIEICLRFSSVRCGDVSLFEVFVIPEMFEPNLTSFIARSLRPLLERYELTNFQPPFFVFYRFLVGMYLSSYLGGEFIRRGKPSFAGMTCTKKVVCDSCKLIDEFLSSGDQSREFVVTNKEWKHLRYVVPKLKDRIFALAVTAGGLWKALRISKLMEPPDEEVQKALNCEELFDFQRCLRLPSPLPGGPQTA